MRPGNDTGDDDGKEKDVAIGGERVLEAVSNELHLHATRMLHTELLQHTKYPNVRCQQRPEENQKAIRTTGNRESDATEDDNSQNVLRVQGAL